MSARSRLSLCLLVGIGFFAACANGESGQPDAPTQTTAGTTSTTSPITSTTRPSTTTTTTRPGTGTGDDACSAAGLSTDVPPQELPQPVADTRRAIVRAAVRCDYEALADIALGGISGFNYSFGDSGAPAEFWREAEARGEDVLRALVDILRLPFATRSLNETTQYLWPSAYAYERWPEVPEADREALRRVYGQDDLRRFEQFGSYSGHRVGIGAAGDWMFFVAGD